MIDLRQHSAAASVAAAALSLVLWAAPAAAATDIFPYSSQYNLRQSDLTRLDCSALWRARNEIFARNGFRFQTARGQAEFGTAGWTSNPTLNRVEETNVALIQKVEAQYCP